MSKENKETCAICLEELEKTNVAITKCNHKFCTSCLLESIHVNNTCPLCRTELTRPVQQIPCFCPSVQSDITSDVYSDDVEIDEWLHDLNLDVTDDNVDTLLQIVDTIITSTLSQTELHLYESVIRTPPTLINDVQDDNIEYPILVEDLVDRL